MAKDMQHYLGQLGLATVDDLRNKLQNPKYLDQLRQQLGDATDIVLSFIHEDATTTANAFKGKACLRLQLQNIKVDAETYLKAFAQEGVDTLQQLSEIVLDKQKLEVFSKGVKVRLKQNLKNLLEAKLEDAVDRESSGNCDLKTFFENVRLNSGDCCEILIGEGVLTVFELKVVSKDKEKYEALLDKIFTRTTLADLHQVFEECICVQTKHKEILKKLGLDEYFPEKITVQEVMKKSRDRVDSWEDVPWFFLSKMLMVDHMSRDDVLSENIKNIPKTVGDEQCNQEKDQMEILDESLSLFIDDHSQNVSSEELHPLDVLAVVFQCSSNFLRQIICEKMFMCKLGIPLVLPPFLDDMPLFLLWSLRDIFIEYHPTEGRCFESSVVSYPSRIVSCLRFDEVSRSKSKFLNEILNGQTHHTFFHKDCTNGMRNRTLSKGLIEVAWYIPSPKSTGKGQPMEVIAFINNRGDALTQELNREFLQNVSDVIIVMIDVNTLGRNDVMSTLSTITSAGAELIVIFTKDSNTKLDEHRKEAMRSCVSQLQGSNFSFIFDFTPSGDRNIKELKKETIEKINKILEKKPPRNTWENCQATAESVNFRVDENAPVCLNSKNKASALVQHIEAVSGEINRSAALPLQSKAWVTWASLNKEEHRLEKQNEQDTTDYTSMLNSEKIKLRKKQLEHIVNPSKLFATFLDNLQVQGDDRVYYLKWLKLMLDDMSRKIIPELQRKYKSKRDELSQYEDSIMQKNNDAQLNDAVPQNSEGHNTNETEDDKAHQDDNVTLDHNVQKDNNNISQDNTAHQDDVMSQDNTAHQTDNVPIDNTAHQTDNVPIDNPAHQDDVSENSNPNRENVLQANNAQHEYNTSKDSDIRQNNSVRGDRNISEENAATGVGKADDLNCDIRETLLKELRDLESNIAEASFGLEHLMREAGQAYEAMYDLTYRDPENTCVPQDIKDRIDKLPQIMAELLLSGYPLELMDGDASHVPILWVKAVLAELEKQVKNKKVFVLSVLGIQSSGKSTMLNAMFGLQFAVAAGRCTRGVFAQLVPLSKENPDMKYDYILVVDTEGLRAPELGETKLQHDNEIATLVLGIGDVTLVNIKGENISDMEDVLQIVVHALLKIKLVQKSFKLRPSCVFIHQNVGAHGAEQRMRQGQQKFIETLDKVTKAAGEQEDAPHYTKFKQIIDLDVSKNIWYFSDLWQGDAPMAPVNSGYSKSVADVKHALLTDIMMKRASLLTVPNFCQKFEDLWNGILGQNFVFCFRNSIEMKVYSSLETILTDLTWSLKKDASEWLKTKRNIIQSQETGVEELQVQLLRECMNCIGENYCKRREELQMLFESSEEKALMEQWRASTYLKLKECYESVLNETKRNLSREIKIRKIQTEQQGNTEKYKGEIENKARKLAEDLREEDTLSTEELEARFYEMWDNWIKHLEDFEMDDTDVDERVVNVLLNEFKEDKALLDSQMEIDLMERIHRNFVFALEKFIIKKPTWREKIPIQKRFTPQLFVTELFNIIDFDIHTNGVALNSNVAWPYSLIAWVDDNIDQLQNDGIVFQSIEWLKFSMSVYACKLASYKLFRKQNPEISKLKYVVDSNCQIDDVKYLTFKKALRNKFPQHGNVTELILKESCVPMKRNLNDFAFDVDSHIIIEKSNPISETFSGLHHSDSLTDTLTGLTNASSPTDACLTIIKDKYKKLGGAQIEKLFQKVQEYLDTNEFQAFEDCYAGALIRFTDDIMKETEKAGMKFKFTKTFKVKMVVHLSQFALPVFDEKHKIFMAKTDPKIVFKRNFQKTYLRMFINLYKQTADEIAFADVLSQYISGAIENTINRDLDEVLADDVRSNVKEVRMKPTFLRAVLEKLLDGSINDIYLYLLDLDKCFDRWIAHFVNDYLFSKKGNMENPKSRYMSLASSETGSLAEQICKDIDEATNELSTEESEDELIQNWIKTLQDKLKGKLPICEGDLTGLADKYKIVNLPYFTGLLKDYLTGLKEELIGKFSKHDSHYLSTKERSIYAIMLEECKGCMERCPFCGAPCSHNNKDHTGIEHMVIEHYPDGCGGYTDPSGQMGLKNCSVLVTHSQFKFMNEDTKSTWHFYKDYKKVYPDWHIDADSTEDSTPYWKWILAQHGDKLAGMLAANPPVIPEGWKNISKEAARQSLYRNVSKK